MKAAVVEAPGRLAIRDVPDPVVDEYDAMCELLYGATCSGTDLHLIDGTFPWPVRYPTLLGHESVGRVLAVGRRVRHFAIGDLITRVGTLPVPEYDLSANWGGYAEFGIARDHRAMREDGLPGDSWAAFKVNQVVPPDINPATATMFITWRETLSYFRRLGVTTGTRVLVIGSGGNGLAFAAHATNLGGTAVVVGSPSRVHLAERVGARACVDYRIEELSARLAASWPDGFDVIVDAVGKRGQLDRVLDQLVPGGTIGIYGLDEWGAYAINPNRARGTFTVYNGGYDEAEAHEEVISLARSGRLDARIWLDLDRPYDLEQIGAAFAAVRARAVVKALIRLTGLPARSSRGVEGRQNSVPIQAARA